MPDKDDVLHVQRCDHTLNVVGLGKETVVVRMAVGLAPAAHVQSDAAEAFGEPGNDLGPGAP